ncbi:MAG: hypothetical protein KBS97_00205 [Firmicutes bacterium]|nr:hypothetical protein [Candidatus Fiminaster equi]
MKNYKSLVKFMAVGAAATLLLTSCSTEDNINKHFNDIDSNISNVIVKVDANESALEEQNEILSDIKATIESHEKSFEEVKNEQIGLLLRHYFDSFARLPEAASYLNSAKDKLLLAMNDVSTIGKALALGTIGGSNSGVESMYSGIAGSGIFDAIGRQPELSETMISFEMYTIEKIKNTPNDLYCEMIGLSASSLFDGIGRSPSIADKFVNYGKYIMDALTNVKEEESSISIGYSSVGFFDGIARQTEAADDMWSIYKDFIDSLVK